VSATRERAQTDDKLHNPDIGPFVQSGGKDAPVQRSPHYAQEMYDS